MTAAPRIDRTLAEFVPDLAALPAIARVRVHGLTLDSRTVRPGDLFVALAGRRQHGLDHAAAAVAAGAVAVLHDRPGFDAGLPVPAVGLAELRARLGAIAGRAYGEPSQALAVVGVTGTNGKTSTVQLLAQAWTRAGRIAGTLGTLGVGIHPHIQASERTTPDVITVHGLLAAMRAEGATEVAMEVSSHALDQGRVDGVRFAAAVFTNLTRDHLDYHPDMDAYFAAKARLFDKHAPALAVINVDDPWGVCLASQRAGADVVTYSADGAEATIAARAVRLGAAGVAFELRAPDGAAPVTSPLLGRFNVANLLAVAGVLHGFGWPVERIAATLSELKPVSGRMNRLGGDGLRPLVVIDYAHTPDALAQALTSLREHTRGRLICVFGCGGERDSGKRPQMAAIAERLADRVIVTDDNPRGEDGAAIIADIQAGFAHPHAIIIERDRAAAIARALDEAAADDIVLVAGKGHEPYQEIGGRRLPFDDQAVARKLLETRA